MLEQFIISMPRNCTLLQRAITLSAIKESLADENIVVLNKKEIYVREIYKKAEKDIPPKKFVQVADIIRDFAWAKARREPGVDE